MHPARKQRLYFVIFIVVTSSVLVSLLLYVFNQNINLFYSPTRIASGEAPIHETIRIGGCVVRGSIQRSNVDLKVSFELTDNVAITKVYYKGILPDLFAEGEAAVARGNLDENREFQAFEVLAKHDENYMPPEAAEALKQAGQYQGDCEI